MKIFFKKLYPTSTVPSKANTYDAGFDLVANHEATIYPGKVVAVGTGIAWQPENPDLVGLVCPRSGLAAKHGVTVVNAPGIVDAGYRGEIKVLLTTYLDKPYEIKAGDRIAQLVVQFVPVVRVEEVEFLDSTDRGTGGFGSSGK